jgi:DNA-binding response OmpR family regulator
MSNTKVCLVIDDDPDDQEIFVMCVKKVSDNINCRTCDSGVEAISMLTTDREFIPGYIFLDVNMPKMSGMECLQELRKIDKLKATKIFMYSTTTETIMMNESKSFGADDFIIKPLKTSELREKLTTIFQSSEIIGNTE